MDQKEAVERIYQREHESCLGRQGIFENVREWRGK